MNSPYMGKFQVTQEFKGQSHDGLDLVGLDSKEIHSTVNGTVYYAGWENSANRSQGFGQYVCIRSTDGKFYYFGHLSEIKVKAGDTVKITDVIGVEGNTGYSTGSHCHYCTRPQFSSGNALNISEISGIPNTLGIYDDGYTANSKKTVNITLSADGKNYSGTLTEK
ncbi:MAG: M23 family metallopeptidase [Ruminococcus sp.]|nr:M23 family metallopeptidase [Ruminococcus sp.]